MKADRRPDPGRSSRRSQISLCCGRICESGDRDGPGYLYMSPENHPLHNEDNVNRIHAKQNKIAAHYHMNARDSHCTYVFDIFDSVFIIRCMQIKIYSVPALRIGGAKSHHTTRTRGHTGRRSDGPSLKPGYLYSNTSRSPGDNGPFCAMCLLRLNLAALARA